MMSYEIFVGKVLKDCWRKLLVKCWSTSVVFHIKWSKECLFERMLCYWSCKGVLTCCLSMYLYLYLYFFFLDCIVYLFSLWFFASSWVCFTINDFKMFHSSERWGWYNDTSRNSSLRTLWVTFLLNTVVMRFQISIIIEWNWHSQWKYGFLKWTFLC